MLKNTFCSSPWIHVRMTYDGNFDVCRWSGQQWSDHSDKNFDSIIKFYNGTQMQGLRQELLNGGTPETCRNCYYQDSHGKVSGRTKQLLKSGIHLNNFEATILSSPHFDIFQHSHNNNGLSTYQPVDLQIDLGNTCNSACIMCHPKASSRLAKDYVELNRFEPDIFEEPKTYRPWARDSEKLNSFINELVQLDKLKYIHFLGGETLYDEAFYAICESLIDAGISKNIIVGITTNGTVYDARLERIIRSFQQFHLGVSIETPTKLNDYIRWPSSIETVLGNIDKFVTLREQYECLYVSARITPNIFSIYELDKLYEYLLDKNIGVESCNILHNPEYLRMELLPDDLRQEVADKLARVIHQNSMQYDNNAVNARRPDLIATVLGNTLIEYHKFITNYKIPSNVDDLRRQLVRSTVAFERLRQNSIIDYVPQYEEFLRTYGY